jgi:hypothetical protein
VEDCAHTEKRRNQEAEKNWLHYSLEREGGREVCVRERRVAWVGLPAEIYP